LITFDHPLGFRAVRVCHRHVDDDVRISEEKAIDPPSRTISVAMNQAANEW
jgi:hypothetical protein